jgi:hypothetical protein
MLKKLVLEMIDLEAQKDLPEFDIRIIELGITPRTVNRCAARLKFLIKRLKYLKDEESQKREEKARSGLKNKDENERKRALEISRKIEETAGEYQKAYFDICLLVAFFRSACVEPKEIGVDWPRHFSDEFGPNDAPIQTPVDEMPCIIANHLATGVLGLELFGDSVDEAEYTAQQVSNSYCTG